MEALTHEDPSHMCPEGALTRRVRVAFLIRLLMMDAMRRDPEDRSALERERAANREEVLDELRRSVAAMCEQPVIRHPDAEHAARVIENQCGEHRTVIDIEQCGYGSDMKAGHRYGRNPVQAMLMFAPIHEHRCRHWRRRSSCQLPSEKSSNHNRAAADGL